MLHALSLQNITVSAENLCRDHGGCDDATPPTRRGAVRTARVTVFSRLHFHVYRDHIQKH